MLCTENSLDLLGSFFSLNSSRASWYILWLILMFTKVHGIVNQSCVDVNYGTPKSYVGVELLV